MITALATFLAPCLPFLWEKAGAHALESAANQIGQDTWNKAQAVWEKLFPKIEQDESTKVVTAELAKDPESNVWQAAFQAKLQSILESDEELQKAITDILNAESNVSEGQGIQITVEHNEGQIIGNMNNSTAKNIGRIDNIQGDISL